MADQVLRHAHIAKFMRAEGATESRTITFVASDESVDSYGDIVRASGWDLKRYKKNPVLLFAHNSSELPVGTTEIGVEGTELIAHASFLPAGVSAKADMVWGAIEHGALRAVSVGFIPTKMPNEIKDPNTNEWTGGYEFIGQELMELSVVPVPANANALAVARAAGMTPEQWSRLTQENRTQPTHVVPRNNEVARMKMRRMRFAIRP